jgi:hypothetical protein
LKEQLSVEDAVNFISYDSAAHFTQFGLSGFSQFCQFPGVSMFRAQGFFCLAALPLLLVTSANRTAVILAHWLIAVVVTVHLRPFHSIGESAAQYGQWNVGGNSTATHRCRLSK